MAKRREFSLLIGACLLATGCATGGATQAQKKDISSKAYNRGWEDASQFYMERADQREQAKPAPTGGDVAVPGEEQEMNADVERLRHFELPWHRLEDDYNPITELMRSPQ